MVARKAKNPDKYGNRDTRHRLRQIILQRDSICYLCGEPVDKSLPKTHRMSAEVEDVVPVSRGGNPTDINNLRLAHKACNLKKGNMSLDAFMATRNLLDTSRKW
jgi:5-methylcytosine-specific restriction endonuclease McrA